MPNPNPNQTGLKPFKPGEGEKLAKRATQIVLPLDVDEILRSLSTEQRIPYLRKIISEAVRRDFA